MTWYFNNDGLADGPHDEATLRAWVKKGRIGPRTLVWRSDSGTEEWQEVETLAPAWWKGTSEPKGKVTSSPAASPREGRGPETRGLTPKAPGAGVNSSGGSFFAKLFNWGKKKG
ncbi:protein of unknown function [Prosthecobacter debontii]|uniref:GYF domain-containing protein n=1 Tax=Prosthecobacter debontii TaxID=48467 RepID=A0A1T4Z1H0_9BACT|nr:protein of unknown function [Prosthecobacter debontii]